MWRRCGRVLEAPSFDWAVSHAMVPFLGTRDDALDLFFSSRDARGRSHTGRGLLTLGREGGSVAVSPQSVLDPGPLGGFDDTGAMGACLVHHEGRLFLYYIGWTLAVTVPFATYIGLAVSDDGGKTFRRASRGPVIGRTDADPFLATSPWVRIEDGRWRMWYASAERWEQTAEGPKHYYRIVYAESADGIAWEPTGQVCIDFADPGEYAIARPCVLRDDDGYHMWFSYRGTAYRIGYASSVDGVTWQRDDGRAGLVPSGEGWDSASVEYGFVFDHGGTRWMLFNGNNYGETGIGLARWDADS